jgi:hemerythrin-like domain-containing protein
MLENFRERQSEIESLISDLKTMLNPQYLSIKPNAKTAHEQLCSLGKHLKEHLAAEDKGVYPPLLTHEDPKLKSLAWGFISGQKPLRQQFESYHQKWLKECNFQFTESFLEETNELVEAIETRIQREQTVLLPRLEQSGVFATGAI